MKKKKIIIDLQIYSKKLGGGKTFIDGLFPFLINLLKKNYQILILCDENYEDYFLTFSNEIKFIKLNNGSNPIKRIINNIIFKLKYDTYLNKGTILWGPLNYNTYIKFKYLVSITTVHDLMVLDHPEFYSFIQRFFRKIQINTSIKNSKRIISVSNFTKERIIYHFNKCPSDVEVIYEGIKKLSDGQLLEPPIKVSDKFLLFVGVGRKNKNLEFLIKVHNKIIENNDFKLLIVGSIDENYRKDLSRISKDISRLIFTGYVSDKVLKKLYERASCFVFPSIYEGFGLPPLEAYINGASCVVSDLGAMKEICSDFAEFASPYSEEEFAMTIINNANVKNHDIDKKLVLSKVFSWEKSAQLYFDYFDKVMTKIK